MTLERVNAACCLLFVLLFTAIIACCLLSGCVQQAPPPAPAVQPSPPDGYRFCHKCNGTGVYVTRLGAKGKCFACNGSGVIEIPPPRPAPQPHWPRPHDEGAANATP